MAKAKAAKPKKEPKVKKSIWTVQRDTKRKIIQMRKCPHCIREIPAVRFLDKDFTMCIVCKIWKINKAYGKV